MPRTYAFASLAGAGVPLAGSSDCPVEPPHPLWGMAAARDRCGLTPEQGLDAGAARHLFTEGAAAAIGEARSLQPGAAADLVVMDVDPIGDRPCRLAGSRHPRHLRGRRAGGVSSDPGLAGLISRPGAP